ncbi:unnamed protein product [Thlaspi arvense]|uniref:Leucine-rich repeat-containing N-terminal plant-type domain-containing protein n=1 Tax=Thlaspi arvense TaxID=13288 RepID=A0AAU9RXI9_THLAR|nr:unnamed protein product [Thlaspi arvense]
MMIWRMWLFFSLSSSIHVSASSSTHLCRSDQKDALWELKTEFYVQGSIGEGWRNNTDCCSWYGVSCDPKTGVVVELDLIDSSVNGPLRSNSSLFRLEHLQSLNLSYNDLSGILPDSIGNLKYLTDLSLQDTRFDGQLKPTNRLGPYVEQAKWELSSFATQFDHAPWDPTWF